jgi:hypothetical protein
MSRLFLRNRIAVSSSFLMSSIRKEDETAILFRRKSPETPLETLDRYTPSRYNDEERSHPSSDVAVSIHIMKERKEGTRNHADLT